MNFLKTILLLSVLSSLLIAIGGMFGGRIGMTLMLFLSLGINLFSWFFSDSMVIRSTGAQPIPDGELQWLKDDLEELSRAAGIPTPRLYITGDPSPNAFATGRSPSKGVVAVTRGLLQTLDRREVKGVLAHELGHIAHRDTLISTVAASISGAIGWVAWMSMYSRDRDTPFWMSILAYMAAPAAAMIIQMSISRTREYAADRRAAELTGDPEGLAKALEGLSRGASRMPMQNQRAASVHMVVNGFSGRLAGWMSTHPPIEERAKRLRAMTDL